MSIFAVQWSVTMSLIQGHEILSSCRCQSCCRASDSCKYGPGSASGIRANFRFLQGCAATRWKYLLSFMSHFIFRMWLKPDQRKPAVDQGGIVNNSENRPILRFRSVSLSECALQVLGLHSPTPGDLIHLFIHPWKRREPAPWDKRSSSWAPAATLLLLFFLFRWQERIRT